MSVGGNVIIVKDSVNEVEIINRNGTTVATEIKMRTTYETLLQTIRSRPPRIVPKVADIVLDSPARNGEALEILCLPLRSTYRQTEDKHHDNDGAFICLNIQ